ncbi:protein-export protein SecB [marine gamma proteobacterium HTCC2143]|jgi:preprotein translocase subunit SecB|uniref:Protein-export protein SecB n=1 Tax=marine gamma proteobacterium HTCC2143 TaxID=247633 RepID=A0YA29_9GAMM|nr:protein-export protein SecB [marine gamma proteobacterium HTCC2143]
MAENEEVQQQFGVQRIFVKDASFESPMGLAVFGRPWQPKVNVDMNTKSEKVSDDSFEVVLTVTVTANLEEEAALLIEVQQAGVFLIKGLEQENLRQALGIMAPSLLFPYLRETIDSLAVKGGFPPISLQPINFEALYRQAAQQAAQQQQGSESVN